MARPVRIEIEGGVYHVISRGTERCDLFLAEADYVHFLDRLAEAQRRFRFSILAYVLMTNHFHLIVCTPEANLSQAIQWLKVSYSMWFNAKYNRSGPLFQGRFRGVLVDQDEGWLLDLSLYVHLNPVRVKQLGLDKKGRKLESMGWEGPSVEGIQKRLDILRSYPWSSYPFFSGYKQKSPDWLDVEMIGRRVSSPAEYRRLAEAQITHGRNEDFISRLKDRVALGSEEFAKRIRGMCDPQPEHEGLKSLRRRYSWDAIVGAVEKGKECTWLEFAFVRGDWGRCAVYYFARRYGGLTLSEIGELAGGVNYSAIRQMLKRFERRMQSDSELKESIGKIERMLNVQT